MLLAAPVGLCASSALREPRKGAASIHNIHAIAIASSVPRVHSLLGAARRTVAFVDVHDSERRRALRAALCVNSQTHNTLTFAAAALSAQFGSGRFAHKSFKRVVSAVVVACVCAVVPTLPTLPLLHISFRSCRVRVAFSSVVDIVARAPSADTLDNIS